MPVPAVPHVSIPGLKSRVESRILELDSTHFHLVLKAQRSANSNAGTSRTPTPESQTPVLESKNLAQDC
jgi:hypothetical protein